MSTRRGADASLPEALFAGTAPDGGLWVPATIERLSSERLDQLLGGSTEPERPWLGPARLLAEHFFAADLDRDSLAEVVRDALSFPLPLLRLDRDRWMLELFHGPTLAFKDIAARTMARLMSALIEHGNAPPRLLDAHLPATVLVATSGDTGAAVAHAFFGLDRFQVVVLYPHGQVSEAQRRLFSTLAGNVRVAAIEGSFDDCQWLVKEAFAAAGSSRERPLLSANSINVGRLLPQTFYYGHLARELAGEPRPMTVAVPSGNFGNLTAGLVARAVGVPIDRFVAATNANDVVPAFLRSGRFEPRPSLRTLSNAMDVGNPSNLERMLWLLPEIESLREVVEGYGFDDQSTLRMMADVARRGGPVLDPHTAVGALGLDRALAERRGGTGAVIATAHPAKFREVLERVGLEVPTPPEISACFERPESITRLPARLAPLLEWL